jgi:hypothetical protein
MREGMQCLLDILRKRAADRALDDEELEAALVLAEEERVLPWAAACLRAQRSLTSTMERRLRQIERDSAIAAFYWSAQLKGVLRAFADANLAVVPLKGPLLAEQLYGSAALRVNRDLDLLVAKADLARSEDVLADLGFVPGDADDYHRQWYRHSVAIELHHDVENPLTLDFDVDSALRRARPADFQGERCAQLPPEDELLFLCMHAARHRFERLSLIVDLQLAFRKLPTMAQGWQPRPEVADLDGLLVLGLAMVRRLQPGFTANVPLWAGPRRRRKHLERLADRLWVLLLERSSESLDWRSVHAFYLEIELPGWPRMRRRYRQLRILASRVIAPDYAFAARFGLHREWQARLLRPVRLMLESVRVAGKSA